MPLLRIISEMVADGMEMARCCSTCHFRLDMPFVLHHSQVDCCCPSIQLGYYHEAYLSRGNGFQLMQKLNEIESLSKDDNIAYPSSTQLNLSLSVSYRLSPLAGSRRDSFAIGSWAGMPSTPTNLGSAPQFISYLLPPRSSQDTRIGVPSPTPTTQATFGFFKVRDGGFSDC